MTPPPIRLDVYHTRVPMRSFSHAAASRDVAEALVVRAVFPDGSDGWGEALPRPYVTGETIESVLADLAGLIWPACRRGEPIPASDAGRCLHAAAGAVDVALAGRLFGPAGRLADPAALLLPRAAVPHKILARVSGILGNADPDRTGRRLWRMRVFGLRDFKLKLGMGDDVDRENLRLVVARLGPRIAAGRCTLRADVNGAWKADEVPARVEELAAAGVCVVEQPATVPPAALAQLAARCRIPLMADESLLTMADARELLAGPSPENVWWNLRIGKNGGWRPTAALATLAADKGIPCVIGCLVGESSILSAAQRRLLQWVPQPRFVEGNWGRFLLHGDLASPSLRFGFGGRLAVLRGAGLGVAVDPRKLTRHGRLAASLEA